ncbi:MAG: hypothetical protein LQ350_004888 [Teloschistes chrysophthalmus]|nr:MAG: hypothetical protein LQ350_004888 [Niorma chrysophthalma]
MPDTTITAHHLPPTPLIPNSPHPLLHYKSHFPSHPNAGEIHALLTRNGWTTQWIYRYGPTQPSHYHSRTHECMIVLHGSATIRFGIADTEFQDSGGGGIEVVAEAGDAFLVPAGVAHKTFNTHPQPSTFKLLTPGDGHGLPHCPNEREEREVLEKVEGVLEGFCMLGAYPRGSADWNFVTGEEGDVGDGKGGFEKVWEVPVPGLDPILGAGEKKGEGMRGLWGMGGV